MHAELTAVDPNFNAALRRVTWGHGRWEFIPAKGSGLMFLTPLASGFVKVRYYHPQAAFKLHLGVAFPRRQRPFILTWWF